MTTAELSLDVNTGTLTVLNTEAANNGTIRACVVMNLAEGDTVDSYLKISGGAKVADLTSCRLYGRLWSM